MLARASPAIAIDELQTWLEWAGSKLLSLNLRSPLPSEPRIAWPDYAQDAHLAYGYTDERLRPAKVSSQEISLMDIILALPQHYVKDVNTRRILNARLLVTPLRHRYLYSWTRIALMLHINRQRAAQLHEFGLRELACRLERDKVYAIRQTFIYLSIST